MRELSLHILDIVQNSLEAGATQVSISIVEDFQTDLLTIQIADNGRGMDENTLAKVLDPFFTTRKTRHVGLGLPLFAAAAQRCNGNLYIESQPGQGTVVTATFQHSHIDRAPLGNIESTLTAILLAQPQIELAYFHRVDDRVFSFDTQEIRQQLGDIPLNYGPVAQWIREYIAENIQALYT